MATEPCRCWESSYALGHDGHCCFLRDDRNRRINDGWRADEDICHRPSPPAQARDVIDALKGGDSDG